jgi:hypothetical protein
MCAMRCVADRPPSVALRTMKAIGWTVLLDLVLAATGCGEIVPLENHGCPCAPGWTCCSGTCVVGACQNDGGAQAACTGSIALGSQTIAQDSDASISPGVEKVTGQVNGVLEEGEAIPFNYATSIWPTRDGWEVGGWLMVAAANQSFAFTLWSEEDGGNVQLPVATYGPLENLGGASCSGTSQGSGVTVGGEVQWKADTEGTYFVAPFHQVTETSSGLAFQGIDDVQYAHSFITVTSVE